MIEKHSVDKKKPLLSTLQLEKTDRIPLWFMRQAGRYLPEYKQIRNQMESFLSCCYTPKVASEITLQPIRRFDLDAAIIFSDILVIPDALGVGVSFEKNTGPQIETISSEKEVRALQWNRKKLEPVYEAIERTAAALPSGVTLIGFAGAPWTLAAYMLEGKSTEQFIHARTWAYANPDAFKQLLALLEDAIIDHAICQIKAGCEVIQLFDSWAGVLSADEIPLWSIDPLTRITRSIHAVFPHIPVIIFPRGAGLHYPRYIQSCGASAISVDQYTNLADLASQSNIVLQGNLDPLLLAYDLPTALARTGALCTAMKGTPFIFNLGHGILQTTPPEHVQALISCVRTYHA